MLKVIKNSIIVVLSTIGGVVAQLVGGWDAASQVLIICMVVGYITGMIVAGVFQHSRKEEFINKLQADVDYITGCVSPSHRRA